MRAVLIHETGGPDVLRFEEAERPVEHGMLKVRGHVVWPTT